MHDKMGDKKGKLYVDQQNLQQISLRKVQIQIPLIYLPFFSITAG